MNWIDALIVALAKWLHWDTQIEPLIPPQSPLPPQPSPMPMNPDSVVYPWDNPPHRYHNIRVLCDEAGLTIDEKNTICACIYQESRFNNAAKCENKDKNGNVWSTDWGICQVNDYFHIGAGKEFPSVGYVLTNQDAVVRWMIKMYQQGLLKQWVSYSSGAYQHWLIPSSPIWALAEGV